MLPLRFGVKVCETHYIAREQITRHALICSFCIFSHPFYCLFASTDFTPSSDFSALLEKCFPFNSDRSAEVSLGPGYEDQGYRHHA